MIAMLLILSSGFWISRSLLSMSRSSPLICLLMGITGAAGTGAGTGTGTGAGAAGIEGTDRSEDTDRTEGTDRSEDIEDTERERSEGTERTRSLAILVAIILSRSASFVSDLPLIPSSSA